MMSKKQPTREDLAAAFRTIRDQYQIIKLQAQTIYRPVVSPCAGAYAVHFGRA
jgi:hypothetical protein